MLTDLRLGDCLDVLRSLPEASVDAVVTDPPYGLSFMGKRWDYDVPLVEVWAECLRVLKPGGHLLAFAGTRTQHRMAVRIEDAGFDIRDMIAWVYGSGFPKSHNLDGDWQGWGTALKPALEPITVARKPLVGTVAANVLEHGTGALNVDGCRVGIPQGDKCIGGAFSANGKGDTVSFLSGGYNGTIKENTSGRWPANLIHDGSEEVMGLFPEGSYNKSGTYGVNKNEKENPVVFARQLAKIGQKVFGYGDTGSAARFFYCAKASKADRDEGCEGLEKRDRSDQSAWVRKCNVCGNTFCDPKTSKPHCGHDDFSFVSPSPRRNYHPTVKPTDLMRYLCRLVTPPGGLVLDPFMGSGSTGKAAVLEGFRFLGIEREESYLAIAKARIDAAFEEASRQRQGALFAP